MSASIDCLDHLIHLTTPMICYPFPFRNDNWLGGDIPFDKLSKLENLGKDSLCAVCYPGCIDTSHRPELNSCFFNFAETLQLGGNILTGDATELCSSGNEPVTFEVDCGPVACSCCSCA